MSLPVPSRRNISSDLFGPFAESFRRISDTPKTTARVSSWVGDIMESVARTYKWQFKTPRGWVPFNKTENSIIDQAFTSSKPEIQVTVKGANGVFCINFERKEMFVEESKTKTKIRFTQQRLDFEGKLSHDVPLSRPLPDHLLSFRHCESGFMLPVIKPIPRVGIGGRIEILVVRGRNIPEGSSSPYLELMIEGKGRSMFRTPACKDGGETPIWNFLIGTDLHHDDSTIHMRIMAEASSVLGSDRSMGVSKIDIPTLLAFLCPLGVQKAAQNMEYLDFEGNEESKSRGLRTWFSFPREGGFPGGEILLHMRFTPINGSKVTTPAETKESFREKDFSLATLSKPDGMKSASPVSTLRLESITRGEKARGKVFGVPLKDAAGLSDTRYPTPVSECVEYVRDCGLREVGIFRVDTAVTRYDKGESVGLEDAHQATGVLKQYFRELPDPLIPFKAYSHFLKIAKVLQLFSNFLEISRNSSKFLSYSLSFSYYIPCSVSIL
ncbi:hypothetical protein AAMO2058_001239700 [Amorphochlora amoebiformis]